jgi:hypothetical protein
MSLGFLPLGTNPLADVKTGAASPDLTISLTGFALTAAQGALAYAVAVPITGFASTAAQGTLTYSAGSNVTVALTGFALTATPGSIGYTVANPITGVAVTPATGSIAFGSALPITGFASTTAQGSLTYTVSNALTGVVASSAAGSVTYTVSLPLTGIAASTAQGSLTYSAASADVTVALSGFDLTAAQGTTGYGVSIPLFQPNASYWDSVVFASHFDSSITDLKGASVSSSGINYVAGKFGNALNADGLAPTYAIYTKASGNYAFGTADFTIDFWAFNGGGEDAVLVIYNGVNYLASISTSSFNGAIVVEFWDSVLGVAVNINTAGGKLANNVWQHFAVVRSGSTFTVYINGVSQATATSSASLYAGANTIQWGSFPSTNSTAIDDLRITAGVARWTTNFAPPTVAFKDVADSSIGLSQGSVTYTAGSDVTVGLTGFAITATPGALGYTVALPLNGVLITGAQGIITPVIPGDLTIALSGFDLSTGQGSIGYSDTGQTAIIGSAGLLKKLRLDTRNYDFLDARRKKQFTQLEDEVAIVEAKRDVRDDPGLKIYARLLQEKITSLQAKNDVQKAIFDAQIEAKRSIEAYNQFIDQEDEDIILLMLL